MLIAALAGIGAGAAHALAGPDHVLSLAPLAVGRRDAWRVGLRWGLGHGAGTLCWAVALLASISATRLQGMDRWAEAAAGLALVAMGIVGLRRRQAHEPGPAPRGIFVVGLVHGASGGSALLLLLPAVVAGSGIHTANYLAGFVAGSTVAMTALTASLARLSMAGGRSARVMARAGRMASLASLALGAFWIGRGVVG